MLLITVITAHLTPPARGFQICTYLSTRTRDFQYIPYFILKTRICNSHYSQYQGLWYCTEYIYQAQYHGLTCMIYICIKKLYISQSQKKEFTTFLSLHTRVKSAFCQSRRYQTCNNNISVSITAEPVGLFHCRGLLYVPVHIKGLCRS
jgi:hypothetical protein